jgi:hypothetical protein
MRVLVRLCRRPKASFAGVGSMFVVVSCWRPTGCSDSLPPRSSHQRRYIFGLLSLLSATLTLPGIAGIMLTIGIVVDGNLLIYERPFAGSPMDLEDSRIQRPKMSQRFPVIAKLL